MRCPLQKHVSFPVNPDPPEPRTRVRVPVPVPSRPPVTHLQLAFAHAASVQDTIEKTRAYRAQFTVPALARTDSPQRPPQQINGAVTQESLTGIPALQQKEVEVIALVVLVGQGHVG
ncbi:hypothetical protein Baya_10775 [Bagarius yarrelli]|uniref:Uncharacterized protein n=1 Tax=Bagarius yarrelli TaxID=175774 RepID=A0A556UZB0_BAGYA|nr:hypothetical protein Baya_10775 [Bagarius yarrelli]